MSIGGHTRAHESAYGKEWEGGDTYFVCFCVSKLIHALQRNCFSFTMIRFFGVDDLLDNIVSFVINHVI